MKFRFFPGFYEDEMFCSGVARDVKFQGTGWENYNNSHFGKPGNNSLVVIPPLVQFLANVGESEVLNRETITLNNSMLPLIAPFTHEERLKILTSGRSSFIWALAPEYKVKNSKIVPLVHHFFMHCPDCMVEDETLHGEYYWHRKHQVYGVNLCYKHGSKLLVSKVETKNYNYKYITAGDAELIVRESQSEIPYFQIQQEIASEVSWLLDNGMEYTGQFDQLIHAYFYLLKRRGFIYKDSGVKRDEAVTEFKASFPQDFFDEIGLSSKIDAWLFNFFKSISVVKINLKSPILHILFCHWNDIRVKDIFDLDVDIKSLGLPTGFDYKKHWPCENPICSDYKREVADFQKYKNKQVYVSHSCGYRYKRLRMIDMNGNVNWGRPFPVEFGDLYIQEFSNDWINHTINFEQLSDKFGDIDHLTLNRRAKRLGLKVPRPGYSKEEKRIRREDLVLSRRDQWETLIRENPEATRMELYKMRPDLHKYFTRNDKGWFQSISLPQRINEPIFLSSKLDDLNSFNNGNLREPKGVDTTITDSKYRQCFSEKELEALEDGSQSQDPLVSMRSQVLLSNAQGESVAQIASHVGYSNDHIRFIIKEFNLNRLAVLTRKPFQPRCTRTVFLLNSVDGIKVILHRMPTEFGKRGMVWTYDLLAEVAFELGLTTKQVPGCTIRGYLARSGISWKHAKKWAGDQGTVESNA
jgi:hypothetical protein